MESNYIGTKINVLDKGHVTLVDFMGDDSSIVQAARVSTGTGTKTPEKDRKLIRYMMRHRHTSVFEQVIFKFHVKAPIFVYRQWHRHRSWSFNEQSGRYSQLPAEFYVPDLKVIRAQSKGNKQGREKRGLDGWDDIAESFQHHCKTEMPRTFNSYGYYLQEDVARELARIELPLATYSEMYATVDLHNLFHFLKLRMDSHAQWECQEYARAIAALIKPIVPMAYEAFSDYVLNAVTFSAKEMNILCNELGDEFSRYIGDADCKENLSKRELQEFKKKLGL